MCGLSLFWVTKVASSGFDDSLTQVGGPSQFTSAPGLLLPVPHPIWPEHCILAFSAVY